MRVLIIAGSIALLGIALYAKEDIPVAGHPDVKMPVINSQLKGDTVPKKRVDDSLNKYRRDTFYRDTFGLRRDSLQSF